MVDPAKDFYQERLVQAAWGQLSAAAAAAGYTQHHGLEGSTHTQGAGGYPHSSNIRHLQNSFCLTQPQLQTAAAAAALPGYNAQNAGKSMQRLPNGGQQANAYNYSTTEQYHRPLPAHSSMPNVSRGGSSAAASAATLPVAGPLPAHMRSHPYQSSSYSHLNPAYNYYPNYPYPSVQPTADKLHPTSQSLNGNNSSYYQNASDPKDFSRSRSSTISGSEKASSDVTKNLSSQQQQQQQHLTKGSTTQQQYAPSAYTYESMSQAYNYQNLYNSQQAHQYLSYPTQNMHRPPTTTPSVTDKGLSSRTAMPKETVPVVTSYQQTQRSYDSQPEKSPSYPDMVSRVATTESFNSLSQRNSSGNGGHNYPATSEVSTTNSILYAPMPSVHTSAPSYMPDAHPQTTYSSHFQNQLAQPVTSKPSVQSTATTTAAPPPLPPPMQPQHEIPQPVNLGQTQKPKQQVPPDVPVPSPKDPSVAPQASSRKSEAWKRKLMNKGHSSEPKPKQSKPDDKVSSKKWPHGSTNDPYAFDDEEGLLPPQVPNNFDFSRFGKDKSVNLASGPVYKFKNALLTRTTEAIPPPASSPPIVTKSSPLFFSPNTETFEDTCHKFIEDLSTKQISISRRASIESWKTTMAAKVAEKEKRKEKKLAKRESLDSKALDTDVIQKNHSAEFKPATEPVSLHMDYDMVDSDAEDLVIETEDHKQVEPLPLVKEVVCTKMDYPENPLKESNNFAPIETQQQVVKIEEDSKVAIDLSIDDKKFFEKENVYSESKNGSDNSDMVMTVQPKVENDVKPGSVSAPVGGKKGTLWALPIVPKLPQKPPEKRPNCLGLVGLPSVPVKKIEPLKTTALADAPQAVATAAAIATPANAAQTSSSTAPIADVWRQAFGAAKPKKPAEMPIGNLKSAKQEAVTDSASVKKEPAQKSILDIPPEVRRRPKPSFGGLIHFSPDWERSMRLHHERCRLPSTLVKNIQVHPKILSTSQQPLQQTSPQTAGLQSPVSTASESKEPSPSPQGNKYLALSSYLGSPSDSSDEVSSPPQMAGPSTSESLLNSSKNVVETILENRKKLRMSVAIGRMFRLPTVPEKKRYNSKGTSTNPLVRQPRKADLTGLMPTPGMPLWIETSEQALADAPLPSSNPFGNFRRQTLLRHLGSLNPELKARMLDWKPEVYETKTRRQSNQVRAVTSYREIFGIDLPEKVERRRAKKRRRLSSKSPTKQHSNSNDDDEEDEEHPSPKTTPSVEKSVKEIKKVARKDKSPNNKEPPILDDKKKDSSGKQANKKERSPTKREQKDQVSSKTDLDSPKNESPLSKRDQFMLKREQAKAEQINKKENKSSKTDAASSRREPARSRSDSASLKKEKNSPKSDVMTRRKRESSSSMDSSTRPLRKDSGGRDSKLIHMKQEEPEIKTEVESEPKKEKRKRKAKPLPDSIPSTSKEDLNLEDFSQNSGGGPSSGARAAIALAMEAAALRALEKEKPPSKRTPKKTKLKLNADDSESETYIPSESEDLLQKELQNFALDLLEDNPSWERRKIIQNLVIWEFVPIDPSLLPPPVPGAPLLFPPPLLKAPVRKKGKKMRKHQSGLDFAKKKTPGKGSRGVSRATTPEVGAQEEVHDITYTLDHLLAEAGRWVIDKSAGETILHRAAKMGYPDVAAYALDMAKMNPVMKDNAGIPPMHKAAFRGHSEIVDLLLRYGADPNTNVKGTRPLHEALDGASTMSVYRLLTHGSDPLLYDYSGNMPIDLAEENEDMLFYFSNILSDLHGKKGQRWNVSHHPEFTMPSSSDEEELSVVDPKSSSLDLFEVTNRLPPPTYQMADREGHFLLGLDFKSATNVDLSKQSSSKFEIHEIARDDFLRLSHCCDLGTKPNKDIFKCEKVKLVKIDSNVKKMLAKADSWHHS